MIYEVPFSATGFWRPNQCLACDTCGTTRTFIELVDVCYDEREILPGPAQFGSSTDPQRTAFVDVSRHHGQREGHEHWCMACWNKKTSHYSKVREYRDLPLLARLMTDEDCVVSPWKIYLTVLNSSAPRRRSGNLEV